MPTNNDNLEGLVKARVKAERQVDGGEKKREPSPDKLTHKFVQDCLDANEDGDAILFRLLNKDYVFNHTERVWYFFENGYWHSALKGEEYLGIGRVIECYGKEVDRLSWLVTKLTKEGKNTSPTEGLRSDFLKRIKALQTKNRKQNVLFLASAGGYGVTSDAFDLGLWAFPCTNGVVDLQTGELRPGRREDYITMVSPVDWVDITEPAPVWKKTLHQIFDGDQDLVDYLQRLLGYGCTGLCSEHVLPILWGQGRNGKTTIVETVKLILGPYAYKCRSDTLLDTGKTTSKGSPDADTLAFRGKRLIWGSETNEGRRFNVALLKEFVSGDTLNARGLYDRTPTTFQPTHTLVLLTNHKPHAPANDFAFWERVHLIPFNISFVDREPQKPNESRADKNLPDKLKMEAPGILAWLVRGCLKWQRDGLSPPKSVMAATAEYRKSEDLVSQFLEEKCELGPKFQVQAGKLYQEYCDWSDEVGTKAISRRKFGENIKSRFDYTTGRHIFYVGVGLKFGDVVQ